MADTEKTTTPPPFLKVTVFPEGKNLYTALGITLERSDEIDVVLKEAFEKCDTFTDAISLASEVAKDIQELAYIVYMIGCHSGKQSVMAKAFLRIF